MESNNHRRELDLIYLMLRERATLNKSPVDPFVRKIVEGDQDE